MSGGNRKWKWHCARKGHTPMEGMVEQTAELIPGSRELYMGHVCRYCMCVYYDFAGVDSGIIKP